MSSRIPPDWPAVRFVETPGQLHAALADWQQAGVLGVDTESNSFYAYHDRLCLMQVTAGGEDWIVDPLALGEELRAINPLLADPHLTKVFHSAEFDLMLLKKDLGAELRGLFDTQVAMTLLRSGKTGLAALLHDVYGLELSKKEQRSDWGRRPLAPAQIAYARMDTHFLPDLAERLRRELEENNLVEAAEGEFRRLEREVLPPREPDPEGWRRIRGARGLDPEAAARLRALYRWREARAAQVDRPPFRILGNEAMLALAKRPPGTTQALAGVSGVGWNKARRLGQEILGALRGARGDTVEDPATRRDPAARRRHRVQRENQEALRRWRKEMARRLDLPSERLIHRRHLEEIGRKLPRTSEELLELVPLNGWQRENLEAELLELLAALPDPDAVS